MPFVNDNFLSLRVHPTIAAALIVALCVGAVRIVQASTEADARHAEQIDRLRADVDAMRRSLDRIERECRITCENPTGSSNDNRR